MFSPEDPLLDRAFSTGRDPLLRLRFRVQFYNQSGETTSKDYSGIGILVSNVLAVVFALIDGWGLGNLMLIYWWQSVLIGFFHFFRIILLKSFCTEGFTSNGTRVPETNKGKFSTAVFFAVHYGFFHLVYVVFLIGFASADGGEAEPGVDPTDGESSRLLWFVLSMLGFIFGHAYSFYQNVRADLQNRPNLGTMMFLPYARIIPMHLTIILGSMSGSGMGSLLLFSGLKTGADYVMHIVEHRVLRRKHVT